MTGFGDQYYEGKELEIQMKEKKPGKVLLLDARCLSEIFLNTGHLSDELKQALGMVEGGPAPWLINMQVNIITLTIGGSFVDLNNSVTDLLHHILTLGFLDSTPLSQREHNGGN